MAGLSSILIALWTMLPFCPPLDGCHADVCSSTAKFFLWFCVCAVDFCLLGGTVAFALYRNGYAGAQLVATVFFVVVPGLAVGVSATVLPIAVGRQDVSLWVLLFLTLASFLPIVLSGSAESAIRPNFDLANKIWHPVSIHQPPIARIGCTVSKRTARGLHREYSEGNLSRLAGG